MIVPWSRGQFKTTGILIPKIISLMPGKTVLGIFILVEPDYNALNLFTATCTLSYAPCYPLNNKGRGNWGIFWPIFFANDDLRGIHLLNRKMVGRLISIFWKVGCTYSCVCWSLSWGDFPTHPLWRIICCKVIKVSAGITFKEAGKPVFVLSNCQSMKTHVVSGKKWTWTRCLPTLVTNYFMWNSNTTIHKETAILEAFSEAPISYQSICLHCQPWYLFTAKVLP